MQVDHNMPHPVSEKDEPPTSPEQAPKSAASTKKEADYENIPEEPVQVEASWNSIDIKW